MSVKKYKEVELFGTVFKLCLDMNALCEFEQLRGKKVGEVFASLLRPQGISEYEYQQIVFNGLSALDVRALIYCLLLRYHEYSERQVGELFSLHDPAVMDEIRKLIDVGQHLVPKEKETAQEVVEPVDPPEEEEPTSLHG